MTRTARRSGSGTGPRYERLFDAAPPGTLRGESTPFYLWDRAAHRRIAATVPDARLIAVVRDPIDRAYSNWTHLRADGLEPEPRLRAAPASSRTSGPSAGGRRSGATSVSGRYGEQLTHLFGHVPREQVHVVRYRELIDEPAATLDGICAFLGVDTGVIDSIPGSNVKHWAGESGVNTVLRRAIRAGAHLGRFAHPRAWRVAQRPLVAALQRGADVRPPLDPAVRLDLVARVADDVRLLGDLLGRSFQDWLGDSGRGSFAVRSSLAPSEREASQ